MKNCKIAFIRSEAGATAVEFAVVLPVLISFIFGLISFGQYFAIANSLQQLAAEAARHSVQELGSAKREALAAEFISQANDRFSVLDNSKFVSQIEMFDAPIPGIQITLDYDLSGSALDMADGFIGLDIARIVRSSYLAY